MAIEIIDMTLQNGAVMQIQKIMFNPYRAPLQCQSVTTVFKI